jgi:type VI protein secretion system component VasF
MIVWISALVFAVALVAMWFWVGHTRRHGHARKRSN